MQASRLYRCEVNNNNISSLVVMAHWTSLRTQTSRNGYSISRVALALITQLVNLTPSSSVRGLEGLALGAPPQRLERPMEVSPLISTSPAWLWISHEPEEDDSSTRFCLLLQHCGYGTIHLPSNSHLSLSLALPLSLQLSPSPSPSPSPSLESTSNKKYEKLS